MSTAPNDPRKPLEPKAVGATVVVRDPPEAAMNLTADAAEISGLRLMDEADKARADEGIPRRR